MILVLVPVLKAVSTSSFIYVVIEGQVYISILGIKAFYKGAFRQKLTVNI